MEYYEILVGDLQYHGTDTLTYSWPEHVAVGTVVQIELRNRKTLGIIRARVPKPTFAVKPLTAVAAFPPVPEQTLALLAWLQAYYPAHLGAIVRQFLPPAVPFPKTLPQKSVEQLQTEHLPPLTPAQAAADEQIDRAGYNLLHGITGSGKTRLYLQRAVETVASGKSAIILTPEIGLTTQLSDTFRAVFGPRVHVLHSRQTAAERRNAWYQILASDTPIIVIGPRSALFAPVNNLGLIVIDESHDQAYKNESAPHYRSERVAAMLGSLHGACVISGSATPSIDEYYMAQAKHRPVITLTALAKEINDRHAVHTKIVDMRDTANKTKSTILSNALVEAVRSNLTAGQQSLLFLNRRGTAAAVLCTSCGWRALCEHCDLPLTYHEDSHMLRCHTCGRTSRLPTSCPECHHADIVLRSIGTKAIATEVTRLFPHARIRRFDSDTTKTEQLETQLETIQKGDIDIIIGTQMITKGLDLPKLSLVGILNADSSLLIPDFTAAERTYQLITQATGRVGRGHTEESHVIVQSYNPAQTVLRAALKADWQAYYTAELQERHDFAFPPFVHLLQLTCTKVSTEKAEQAALALKSELATKHRAIAIDGPSPSFHPRENRKYKWQLIVKAKQRGALLDIVSALPSGWSYDIDPTNLL